jgi:hypothetical protein
MTVSIDANLTVQAFIEERVCLHLNFAEQNESSGVGGYEYPINSEAGFFDFN